MFVLAGPVAAAPYTFTVDYVVTIRRRDPEHAHVRWLLAGIDEIESLRLGFRDDRTTGVAGTGTLVWEGRVLHWTPGAPYAHLDYTVAIARRRPPARFDSYAATDWVATRALHLFPEINVRFRRGTASPKSRARLIFRVPRGWHTIASARTGRDGAFDLRYEPSGSGSEQLRIRFAGDGANSGASSNRQVTVYEPSVASWYYDGGNTACGFHAFHGVANKTLPCGTKVALRYNGRSVTATVDDRGPFVAGRDWDLNENTAAALGFGGVGTVLSSQ